MRAFKAPALLLCLLGLSCVIKFDESLLRDSGPIDMPPCPTPKCDDKLENLVGCDRTLETCLLGCVADPQPHCRRPVPSNSVQLSGQQTADVRVDKNYLFLDACKGTLGEEIIPGSTFTTQKVGTLNLGVLRVRSLRLNAGVRLRVTGECALAIVADQTVEIAGTLDLGGGLNTPFSPGPGGGQGAFAGAAFGCGKGGTEATPGGGGGAGFGAGGGAGGKCGVGSGVGGQSCGTETLEPLVGGSGGGRGCKQAPCEGGYGGGGGGALQLVAGQLIKVLKGGAISVAGAGGGGGKEGSSGGGGGGSGGAILLEAPRIELEEGGWLAAGGGGGGGVAASSATDLDVANGQSGLADSAAAAGGTGVAAGGAGSSSANSGVGQNGEEAAGSVKACGGGGGGWGRIRLNSGTGEVPAPSVHGAVTQGKIASK